MWDVALRVDGDGAGALAGVPMLFGMAPFEGIDVGHRPPLAGVVGDLRALRPVPVHRRAALGAPTGPATCAPDAPDNMVDMLREMGMAFE